MIDLTSQKIVLLSINLIFFTLMHDLTSKFTPHLKHQPIIYHSPYLIPHLTSINNPFWDHLCTQLAKKAVNLSGINLNFLTLL